MRIKAGTSIRQRFLWLPVVLAALAALWPAPSALAAGEPAFGCGHVHTAEAQRNPYGPDDGPPPIAIGDSTMLLPIPDLTRVGFDVNAKGCRGFKQSVWVARDLRNQGALPKLILINAYGNGGVNDDLIKFALKVIGPKRTLVLVTAYDADTGEPPAPGHRRAGQGCDRTTLTRSSCSTGSSTACPTTRSSRRPAPGSSPTSSIRTSPALTPTRTSSPRCCPAALRVRESEGRATAVVRPGGRSHLVLASLLALGALFLVRRRVQRS